MFPRLSLAEARQMAIKVHLDVEKGLAADRAAEAARFTWDDDDPEEDDWYLLTCT